MARKISRPAPRGRTATVTPPIGLKTAAVTGRTAAVPMPRSAALARTGDEELVENFFLGVLLFFLAVLVFYPAFHAGFIWDDDQLLTANLQVHSPDGWKTLWLNPATADYFPLTSTTLWLEWKWWGMNANCYHITNVLLHATTAVLTWQALKRLRVPGAWVAAALFAVHPVCVESVAWISERKNTISQIFFLLSIINFLRFEDKGRVWRYVAAVLCFTLALLAKTSVVMLPFILLILAWWRYSQLLPLRSSYTLKENPTESWILTISAAASGAIVAGGLVWAILFKMHGDASSALVGVAALAGAGSGFVAGLQLRRFKIFENLAAFEVIRSLPFFIVAFVLGLVTIYFQYGRAIGQEVIPIGNMWQRTCSACFAAGFYLYSALWPFNIIEIYPQWHRAFAHPGSPAAPEALPYWQQVIPGLLITALLVYCWVRRAESWARAMLVGLGVYFVAMLPALGFLTMSYMRLTLVADHFQYISIVCVIALIVAAGYRRVVHPLVMVAAAIGFAFISYINWNQTQDNHIEQVVWIVGAFTLAIVPRHEEMLWKWVWGAFLGAILICSSVMSWAQTGTYHDEETLWSTTLEKNPNTWQGHNHLGAALYLRGDIKDAFPHFAMAVKLKPENPESHNNLGLALSYFGMKEEAVRQYEIAVSIKDDPAMDTNLANAYEEAKRYDDAIRMYHHAIDLANQSGNPNASAYCNLGYALMQEGKVDEAINDFIATIKISPTMPQGRNDLLQALRMKGINPDATTVTGTYGFDAQGALNLLHSLPPPPPGQQTGPPQ